MPRDEEDAVGSTGSEVGRRAQTRRRTWAELKAAALDEVREHGAVALSLRRVARRIGMSPAGLYRYVDSREDLLTTLIADAYDDLADHLLVAVGAEDERRADTGHPSPAPPLVAPPDADVADRLRAVALAYRHWGVTHTQEFGLLFGDPIPGYAAPAGGPTVAAMTRVGTAMGRPLVEAWHQGRLRPRGPEPTPELAALLAPMAEVTGGGPPALAAVMLTLWGRIHGQVSLEVFGHHAWLFPDGCEALFTHDVEALLADLGVVEVST